MQELTIHTGYPPVGLVIADPPYGIGKGPWDKFAPSVEEWKAFFFNLEKSSLMASKFAVAVYCQPTMFPDIWEALLSVDKDKGIEGRKPKIQRLTFITDKRPTGDGGASLHTNLTQEVIIVFRAKHDSGAKGNCGGRDQYFFDFSESDEDKEDKSMQLAPFRMWPPVLAPNFAGWRSPLSSVSCWYYDLGSSQVANETQKPIEGEGKD